VAFCRRLQDSWPDLADLLGVRQDERRRFRRGYEAQDLWEWLDARQKLGELPEALAVVGRPDLRVLLEDTADPVPLSDATQLLLDLSAAAVRDANVLIDTGHLRTPNVHLAEVYVRRGVEEVLLARTLRQEITAVVGEPGTHRPGRS
jgi:hypothetical protein